MLQWLRMAVSIGVDYLEPVLHRNMTRSEIDEELGNEERRYFLRTLIGVRGRRLLVGIWDSHLSRTQERCCRPLQSCRFQSQGIHPKSTMSIINSAGRLSDEN